MKSLVTHILESMSSVEEINKLTEKYLKIVEKELPNDFKKLGLSDITPKEVEEEMNKHITAEDVEKDKKLVEAFAKANKSEKVNKDTVWENFTIYLPKDKSIKAFGLSRQFYQHNTGFMNLLVVFPLKTSTLGNNYSYWFTNMSKDGDFFEIGCPVLSEERFFDEYKDLRKHFTLHVCPFELGDKFVELFNKYRK